MNRRYSILDNYQGLVAIAKSLKIKVGGISKVNLVQQINAKLDQLELESSNVTINLIEAADALSDTEFHILEVLLGKVLNHKTEREASENNEHPFFKMLDDLETNIINEIFPGAKIIKMSGLEKLI